MARRKIIIKRAHFAGVKSFNLKKKNYTHIYIMYTNTTVENIISTLLMIRYVFLRANYSE